jgi:hypothetical protein
MYERIKNRSLHNKKKKLMSFIIIFNKKKIKKRNNTKSKHHFELNHWEGPCPHHYPRRLYIYIYIYIYNTHVVFGVLLYISFIRS